uniref:Dynein regulatory complex subunit 2 n=1 Tax=Chromera velia CCMP2878 TaxID=1169474 RepID=A0A0G4HVM7_9ALVE|eukprot:Cvel_1421.t1-p1 / transcript=Cvel_1421.t1 / gene=Cvel_1421 / organism=Chromera_velia_CCMP2878 / gene_product=Coiled-coil domain-containing protein 65, putative / transcript_product=Coiled-coil domain-containing protein 65, putative / location=Cvel_scaffold49:133922-138253(-) / protein_length=513 / sequence_SO=supercontig / SO=protein_coding / is_pseudo=false
MEDPAAGAGSPGLNLVNIQLPIRNPDILEHLKALPESDKDKFLNEIKKKYLKQMAAIEEQHSKHNMFRVQEAWLKIMRAAKTAQLKKEVEILSQNHQRDVDRKEALLHMMDRDLDEAEEQQLVASRSHFSNVGQLLDIQTARLEAVDHHFQAALSEMRQDFAAERRDLEHRHSLFSKELQLIVHFITKEEEEKEQAETHEHNTQFEVLKNRNIEEDHQTKSKLEDAVDTIKDKCNQALQDYKTQTDSNTQEYKKLLHEDDKVSREVDQRLRRVERLQQQIADWKSKIIQNRSECEERNSQLRLEKEELQRHYQELKAKMSKFRAEQMRRLRDLSSNAKECTESLDSQLKLAERILQTAALCRKLETEREKVVPFYLSREVDLEELDWSDVPAEVKEEIREALSDVGIDEWTYLDSFFKRYNKVFLDKLAIDKERQRLEKENEQLRSILKQFLDGVSVNDQVLGGANPLLVVNGRVNFNHIPVKRDTEGKVTIEAQTHVHKTTVRQQQILPRTN